MIVLFGISLIALVLLVGLVVDGGFAFVERRNVQKPPTSRRWRAPTRSPRHASATRSTAQMRT